MFYCSFFASSCDPNVLDTNTRRTNYCLDTRCNKLRRTNGYMPTAIVEICSRFGKIYTKGLEKTTSPSVQSQRYKRKRFSHTDSYLDRISKTRRGTKAAYALRVVYRVTEGLQQNTFSPVKIQSAGLQKPEDNGERRRRGRRIL